MWVLLQFDSDGNWLSFEFRPTMPSLLKRVSTPTLLQYSVGSMIVKQLYDPGTPEVGPPGVITQNKNAPGPVSL